MLPSFAQLCLAVQIKERASRQPLAHAHGARKGPRRKRPGPGKAQAQKGPRPKSAHTSKARISNARPHKPGGALPIQTQQNPNTNTNGTRSKHGRKHQEHAVITTERGGTILELSNIYRHIYTYIHICIYTRMHVDKPRSSAGFVSVLRFDMFLVAETVFTFCVC